MRPVTQLSQGQETWGRIRLAANYWTCRNTNHIGQLSVFARSEHPWIASDSFALDELSQRNLLSQGGYSKVLWSRSTSRLSQSGWQGNAWVFHYHVCAPSPTSTDLTPWAFKGILQINGCCETGLKVLTTYVGTVLPTWYATRLCHGRRRCISPENNPLLIFSALAPRLQGPLLTLT